MGADLFLRQGKARRQASRQAGRQRPSSAPLALTGGWMCGSIDSEMREKERNEMEMAMAM